MEAYIKILKFASDLQSLTYENLFNYIHKNDIRFHIDYSISESNSQLINIFRQDFVDDKGDRPDMGYRGIVYLKPEALAYLLNYESLQQAKEDANAARAEALEATRLSKRATNIAIWSVVITAVLAIVQIYLQLREH